MLDEAEYVCLSCTAFLLFHFTLSSIYPLPAKVEGEGGEAYRAEYDDHNLLTENTLSYLKTLDSGHTFDGLLGFTGQRLSSNDFSLNGKVGSTVVMDVANI